MCGARRERPRNHPGGCMSPFLVLNIQSTFSLAAFALIAWWHVEPRLRAWTREQALMPLLWVQVFRYPPLALYAPGHVLPRIPPSAAAAVGLGHLASAVVA